MAFLWHNRNSVPLNVERGGHDVEKSIGFQWKYSFALILLGVLVRAGLAFYVEPFLHWDEAPQAYMAQLISHGKIAPFVHFQLPYIGAVEQYPLALLMLLIGDGVGTVNLFYFVLSIASLCLASLVYSHFFTGGWANLALALYALGHPLVLLFSLQGYSFAGLVVLECLIMWLLVSRPPAAWSPQRLLLLGLLNGVSLYNNILSIGMLMLSAWHIVSNRNYNWSKVFVVGFTVGYSPMVIFNLANDLMGYKLLVAKFFGVTKNMLEAYGATGAVLQGAANKVLGQGPPSDAHLLFAFPRFFSSGGYVVQVGGLLAVGVAVACSLFALLKSLDWLRKRVPHKARYDLLALYICALTLAVPAFGQVRYMTVLLIFLPIMVCNGLKYIELRSRPLALGLGSVVVAYLAFSHIAVLADDAGGMQDEYAPVISFLEKNNLNYGYASYPFQAYAAFMSRGQIKISTQIGPVYIDKLPVFSLEVDDVDDVFYVFPRSGGYTQRLEELGVTYQHKKIGRWIVVWQFSKRLYPLDILSARELARDDGYYRWSYRANPAVMHMYRGGH